MLDRLAGDEHTDALWEAVERRCELVDRRKVAEGHRTESIRSHVRGRSQHVWCARAHIHAPGILPGVSLFGVFGAVALVELVVFVLVEREIGLLAALLIALGTALAGSVLVRRAGLAVMSRFRERLSSGSLPGRELTHGAAVLVSGALLISPGFFTDVVGFVLLVPAVRDFIHARVAKRFAGQVVVSGETGTVIDVDAWEHDA